jgi:hypothetical protein
LFDDRYLSYWLIKIKIEYVSHVTSSELHRTLQHRQQLPNRQLDVLSLLHVLDVTGRL